MSKGLLFSIEEFAIFDGPGIRTAVFFKGCPLHCNWCHNPEGLTMRSEIVRSPNGCIKCGRCYALAAKNGGVLTEECIDVCPRNLIRRSGIWYDDEELYRKILKNKDLFEFSGGGVTFSGGECLMQADFLLDVLKKLGGQVHVAIETSGYCNPEKFAAILPYVDLVMFDLKILDKDKFREYTGGDISIVLHNFETLVKSGKKAVPRTPLIPGVSDTDENLTAIAQLLYNSGKNYAELLPYNTMAGSKYELVGKKYEPMFDEKKLVNINTRIFQQYGIETKIM